MHDPSGTPVLDLGDEPPLLTDDDRNGPPDRRKVSLRWLSGTVLTALTSIFLMGGALFAALEGRVQLAVPPTAQAAIDPLRDSLTATSGRIRKGDKIKAVQEKVTSRNVLQVSTVSQVGDEERIKVRPFIHVTTSLPVRASDQAIRIPAFNPTKIFASGNEEPARAASDSIYSAKVDGEVSVSKRPFPLQTTLFAPNVELATAEVERIVRDSARFLTDGTVRLAALPVIDPDRFDFELAAKPDLSKLAVRIIPENVSSVTKRDDLERDEGGLEEKTITVGSKDTLSKILKNAGAGALRRNEIIGILRSGFSIDKVKEGQKIRLSSDPEATISGGFEPVRVSIYSAEGTHLATAAMADHGRFVAADEPQDAAVVQVDKADTVVSSGPLLSVYRSVYQAALEQKIPDELIADLIRIYAFDVDFNGRIRAGDMIQIFFSDEETADAPGEILYTSIKLGDTVRRYYRFRTADDGYVDFYDERGKSAKKFLMRKPVARGRFRSAFGMRRHPVFGYYKMHTGVDWATSRGTPIMASGNGVVEEVKWRSGNGRYIKIRHANGYKTTYSHMSAWAKGIRPGVRIRQGRVIGYVGSTGLSTGPHLHYEVLVNGRHVDPMRIRLPRGRVLKGDVLAAFNTERNRIDDLLGNGDKSNTKLASSN